VKFRIENSSVCKVVVVIQLNFRRSRLNACVRVNGGHRLNINFEPLTFCCVLFVSSILVSVNVIDINMCKVLILCEMCYFCV